MSTASLLRWIALVAGAELAVRGHLSNHAWTCHAGAAIAAIALAAICQPTRARRAGAIAAALLLALTAIDASISAFAKPPQPPPASLRERAGASPPESPAAAPAPGGSLILVFAGRDPDGQPALSAALLGAALRDRISCQPPIAVVDAAASGALGDPAALSSALARFHPRLVLVLAANELLDDVIAESPELDFPAPEEIGPRGSPLGRRLEGAFAQWRRERAWRHALGSEAALDPRASRVVARYRALVLAARRGDAEVALLIPALAISDSASVEQIRSVEVDAPRARAWLLASRAHAHGLRVLAGSYGVPAIDTGAGLVNSAGFAEFGQLDAAGRTRLAQSVADSLAARPALIARECSSVPARKD
jgi:hypothetical protein